MNRKKIIGLNYKGKEINLEVKKCSFFGRFRGLMFCKRDNAEALLFKFTKPSKIFLHSFFVFFPFVVLWLDNKNNVLEIRKCKSFEFLIKTNKKFSKIVEIPFNKKYEEDLKIFL